MVYPTDSNPTALINTSILLEMGVRGGPHPHEAAPIGSLLGDLLLDAGTVLNEFADLQPIDVQTLHPARTLLEKLILVHQLDAKIEGNTVSPMNERIGRHFYDIYELLADARVLEFLSDHGRMNEVIESVASVNRTHFDGIESEEVRPFDGFATCQVFELNSDASQRLQRAYEETMPELYFGRDPLPSWKDICGRVTENRNLL